MDLIHFRMVVPSALTGAADLPGGDAVECDVLKGAANGVRGPVRRPSACSW
jgi:hypothetical protein